LQACQEFSFQGTTYKQDGKNLVELPSGCIDKVERHLTKYGRYCKRPQLNL